MTGELRSIADIVRRHARQRPRHTAVVCSGRLTSYSELDERSSRAARALAETVSPQGRIGVLDTNSGLYFELLLAAAKAGRVLVPLNYRLAGADIAAIIADASIELLFVGEPFVALLDAISPRCPTIRHVIHLGSEQDRSADYVAWRNSHPAVDPRLDTDRADVVLQVYTSGTVGEPKGVLLTHGNLLTGLPMLNVEYGSDPTSDVGMVCMPMYHVSGCHWGLTCLYSGLTTVVVPRVTAPEVLGAIASQRVTIMLVVPAVIHLLLATPERPQYDVTSLRLLLYGASPIPLELLQRALTAFSCDFGQVYGLTESGGAITYLAPADHDLRDPGRLLSCGRALRQAEVRVVDSAGVEQAVGSLGEVVCRTPQNMAGYWRRLEATQAVLRDGWLHTGDVGHFDQDGYLYIHDRLDDMIISGGENVYPSEIERTLLAHPAIADAAAIGIPDPQWGEAIVAFIVLRAEGLVSADQALEFARERMTTFKAPKRIEIRPHLPRNAAGKLLRKDLRAPFWAGRLRQRRVGEGTDDDRPSPPPDN